MSLTSAQARLERYQERIAETSSELGEAKSEGKNSSGQVKIGLRGDFTVRRVKIAPELLDAEDSRALEQAVAEALTDALTKVQNLVADRLADVSV